MQRRWYEPKWEDLKRYVNYEPALLYTFRRAVAKASPVARGAVDLVIAVLIQVKSADSF